MVLHPSVHSHLRNEERVPPLRCTEHLRLAAIEDSSHMDLCTARGGVPFVVLRAHHLILGSWQGRDTCGKTGCCMLLLTISKNAWPNVGQRKNNPERSLGYEEKSLCSRSVEVPVSLEFATSLFHSGFPYDAWPGTLHGSHLMLASPQPRVMLI